MTVSKNRSAGRRHTRRVARSFLAADQPILDQPAIEEPIPDQPAVPAGRWERVLPAMILAATAVIIGAAVAALVLA